MIILTGHTKGGGGKSTIAINIAVELQHRGNSVIIIEADPSVKTCSNWADDREDANLPGISVVRRTGRLRAVLEDSHARYDYVIVDTAGKDSEEMRSASLMADVLIIPSRPTRTDLDTTAELVQQIRVARDFNPKLVPLMVISQADTHPASIANRDARQNLTELGELENVQLAETILHHRTAYSNALRDGTGVVEGDDPKAIEEVRSLVNEILSYTHGTA